jgi:hypothetical protein
MHVPNKKETTTKPMEPARSAPGQMFSKTSAPDRDFFVDVGSSEIRCYSFNLVLFGTEMRPGTPFFRPEKLSRI